MVLTNRKKTNKKKTKRKKDKFQLIKKACKQFDKPIYLMRHLHTDANLIADSFIGKTYKKLRGTKGGSLKHYLPVIPGLQEPSISAWGRNDGKKLANKYGITKVKHNHYTIIVSPLVRTWISALLFIRGLMKHKGFILTLLIAPLIEIKGLTGNTPLLNSYQRFKDEVKDNETVQFKMCDNINRKKYTCTLKDIVENTDKRDQLSITDMYSKFKTNKYYKSFKDGGMSIDESLLMLSTSCKAEFKHMKEILVYSHSGAIKNQLTTLDVSKEQINSLDDINGYAIIFTIRNNKVKIDIKYP